MPNEYYVIAEERLKIFGLIRDGTRALDFVRAASANISKYSRVQTANENSRQKTALLIVIQLS